MADVYLACALHFGGFLFVCLVRHNVSKSVNSGSPAPVDLAVYLGSITCLHGQGSSGDSVSTWYEVLLLRNSRVRAGASRNMYETAAVSQLCLLSMHRGRD